MTTAERGRQRSRSGSGPTYLNTEYVARALRRAFGAEVQVLRCVIGGRTGSNGDNFCSDIYRVEVEFARPSTQASETAAVVVEGRCLIVKAMLPEVAGGGTNEHDMYEQVLPLMEQLMNKNRDQDHDPDRDDRDDQAERVRFSAFCFMADRIGKEVFVLEDLTSLGYRLANRFEGLDAAHAKLLMRKIGEFHAVSMVFALRHPSVAASLQAGHFAEGANDPLVMSIAFGGMEQACEIVEGWPDYGEVAEKMRALVPKFYGRIKSLFDPARSAIRVVNHGDLWVNNFMYSYEEAEDGEEPNDVVFLDFQNSFLGSPGWDIHYFLSTSVRLDVLQSQRYTLQRIYYRSLRRTLTQCEYPTHLMPKWQTLVDELRRTEFMAYYAIVCELPLCCMSPEISEGMSSHTLTDPEAMEQKRRLMYANPRVVNTLRYSLDRFNELRVLD